MPTSEPPSTGPAAAIDRWARRLVILTGRLMGLVVLAIVAVIAFDVLTRGSMLIGSTALQELEWHLHTTAMMLCLGYAYLTDSHVRIGLLRDRWGPRTKALVEASGCVLFLIPFTVVALFYGVEFATTSFSQGERSPSPGGLAQRWIVKAMVPFGMGLLLLAGLSVLARSLSILLGRAGEDTPLFPDRPEDEAHG